ncbi:MAG: PLP-dependent aminotransferase family protein [Candidatus Eisenbacteria bacterium]|nr:PLP-dependent aminotransferase family protein [Candidatus Eisenbacteria bacterium]
MNRQTMSANFLRGVPAEEALSHLIPMVSEGYEKVIKRHGVDVLQYGHFSGFKRLRKLLGQARNTDPGRIIVGNGGMEVISLLFKSLPRESFIVVEESTYDRVVFDAERYGHKLVGVRMTSEGLDIDELEKVANKISAAAFYGIPFHHNPTGITYSSERRKAVEEICRKHNILCAWDICYESLRYDGGENEPIEVSEWGPVLISSFTKTISPGTKCGYIVLPKDRIEYLEKVVTNTRLNPNLPTQAFIADFIESGKYKDYLDYLRGLYKPRMDALNVSLSSNFPGLFPAKLTGGFFATLSLKKVTREKEKAFIDASKEAGVSITPAWGALAPNLVEEKRKEGLLIRLTFPASKAEQIAWGISKLKELEEKVG